MTNRATVRWSVETSEHDRSPSAEGPFQHLDLEHNWFSRAIYMMVEGVRWHEFRLECRSKESFSARAGDY